MCSNFQLCCIRLNILAAPLMPSLASALSTFARLDVCSTALSSASPLIQGVPEQHPLCAVDCRYILPSLSLVPSDHEESVKVQYALVLAQLAAAANRFLLHLQQLANTQLQPDPSSPTLVSPSTTLSLLM